MYPRNRICKLGVPLDSEFPEAARKRESQDSYPGNMSQRHSLYLHPALLSQISKRFIGCLLCALCWVLNKGQARYCPVLKEFTF